jgi:hypothetical protein
MRSKPAEQALIDEYGELDRQLSEFRPVVSRHKTLKETIAAWFDESAPAETHTAEGKLYVVQVSPRSLERRITNMKRLQKLLGLERFLTWCTFPLAAVDRLTEDQSSFLESTRTGSRTVKPVLKKAA